MVGRRRGGDSVVTTRQTGSYLIDRSVLPRDGTVRHMERWPAACYHLHPRRLGRVGADRECVCESGSRPSSR